MAEMMAECGQGVHKQSIGVIYAHSRVKSRYSAYPARHTVPENRGGHEKRRNLPCMPPSVLNRILQTVL
jgi:hypothetical protein